MASLENHLHNYYLQTHCRMPPLYIIGILLGLILHKTGNIFERQPNSTINNAQLCIDLSRS